MQCYTILYTRKSSKDDDRQVLSLAAQEKECREYAARQGLTLDVVIPEAHSAKQPGRPLFEGMLEKAHMLLHKGVTVSILCHKPDRLLRNIGDWARINDLMESGVRFLFVTGSYPNNAQGKMIFGINVVFAKYYVDNLSEEVKKGLDEKLARGEWPGWAPLGYRNARKRIVLDPIVAPLIREAFECFATGEYSLASLARQLYAKGLAGRWRGKMLTKSVLRDRILTNPFYCGLLRYRGAVHAGSHEPLISIALFEEVQAILTGRARPRRIRHSFRYGGLIACSHCACAVVGDIKKERYVYYRCSHRRQACSEGYVREERLRDLFGERLGSTILMPPSLIASLYEAADELQKDLTKGIDPARTPLERRLQDLGQRKQALLDLRLAGHIDNEEFTTKRAELTLARAKTEEEFAALEKTSIDPRQAVEAFVRICNNLGNELRACGDADARRLLRIVGSNYRYGHGTIDFEPVKPFDLASQARSRPNWRAGPDEVRSICAAQINISDRRHGI